MPTTIDENLVKEFKKNIRLNYRGFITTPPLPKLPKAKEYSGMYVVRGIPLEEKYYSKLNETIVRGLRGNVTPAKRVLKKTGEVDRDSTGKIIREEISIPKGMSAILTPISLHLPYGYQSKGGEFQYVDFFEPAELEAFEGEKGNQRLYMYLVDQKYLYEFNQIALVYSNKKLSKTYVTIKVQTWCYGVVYLSLIPFENNTYRKAQVLKTGTVNDFQNIIPGILKHWVLSGFICDPVIFAGSEEGESVVLQQLEGNLEVPMEGLKEISLAESKGKGIVEEQSLFDIE